ncbi:MAG TPA: DUF4255 domain-containing protein [Isosphaeraceae bacterium]|nr:DUF4255 domain-containing protein [Isosphaeraceae bacterium]
MSDALAIAAVTSTLRNLIALGAQELGGATITVQPPDKARGNLTTNQINLFLYQVLPNAAWRNQDYPTRVKPGEVGSPPLALNLYYMLTVFGNDNEDDVEAHRLLGRAMNVLHDHPLLGRQEIRDALPESNLADQIERIRFTLQPLSEQDIFQLWSGFQANYRLSVSYEATVVLIDSTQPLRAAQPVLGRGQADIGPQAQAGISFPTISELKPPGRQPAARLGDVLTVSGANLFGDILVARFRNPLLTAPIDVPPTTVTPSQVTVPLQVNPATDPANWPAGIYTISLVPTRAGRELPSNELAFSLAPRITTPAPLVAIPDPSGNLILSLACVPTVRPTQRASVLLGEQEVVAAARTAATDPLTFDVTNVPASQAAGFPTGYVVRLRVDGVDSMPFDPAAKVPAFDPAQRLVIP